MSERREVAEAGVLRATHRAPVPAYDVSDEEVNQIEAERTKKKRR
jgi:hypothetical protein